MSLRTQSRYQQGNVIIILHCRCLSFPRVQNGTKTDHDTQNWSRTWRELWLNFGLAEQELGLPITDEVIQEMGANQYIHIHPHPSIYVLNYVTPDGSKREKKATRCNDHVHTFKQGAPATAGIIQYVSIHLLHSSA